MLDTELDNVERDDGEPAGFGHGGVAKPPVPVATFQPPQVIFQPPNVAPPPAVHEHEDAADHEPDADDDTTAAGRRRRRRGGRGRGKGAEGGTATAGTDAAAESAGQPEAGQPGAGGSGDSAAGSDEPATRPAGSTRSRRRGGAGRDAVTDKPGADQAAARAPEGAAAAAEQQPPAEGGDDDPADGVDGESAASRRRRRRRRRGAAGDAEPSGGDDPPNTVVHVREPRPAGGVDWDEVQSVKGSTRLEAKKQRRREGRDSGRRRPPVLSESEFLARREAVQRVMLIRQQGERIQIAVLEDEVLVEHYVDRASHQSMAGNIYLGKVQNVLPSMEAAFVDIGKGRNAVLYAGEINFDASGLEGQPKRIEMVLKSGQSVLVQVTKDPVGHKGARLTNQVSLPGRYLVYVPGASMTGISRKLPATERTRLKQILRRVTPEDAGVIVRTAAEGTGEEELGRDVARLAAQWENIQRKASSASPPALLYSEPDLTIRVVRDIFNEDFGELVVAGDEGWDTVNEYVRYVAPHLAERLRRWQDDVDVFAKYRIDEQLAKALERKVWLPSGGSLVIDRTEAMTVIDVNTGKFTGQGGNLEETVTRNNLEAAEEIVRQLRLRDIGGIIVIDFIDMVLESNRELVLRRLLECLARDRTKHQVAEVTSLGLVQMTRKRVGTGLLEAFSEPCECCNGRGLHVSLDLLESPGKRGQTAGRGGRGDSASQGRSGGTENGRGAAAATTGDGGSTGTAGTGRTGGRRSRGGEQAANAAPSPGEAAEEKPASRRRRRRPVATSGNGQPAADADAGAGAGAADVADPVSAASPAGVESSTDAGSGHDAAVTAVAALAPLEAGPASA
jgi:ribonuclease E